MARGGPSSQSAQPIRATAPVPRRRLKQLGEAQRQAAHDDQRELGGDGVAGEPAELTLVGAAKRLDRRLAQPAPPPCAGGCGWV